MPQFSPNYGHWISKIRHTRESPMYGEDAEDYNMRIYVSEKWQYRLGQDEYRPHGICHETPLNQQLTEVISEYPCNSPMYGTHVYLQQYASKPTPVGGFRFGAAEIEVFTVVPIEELSFVWSAWSAWYSIELYWVFSVL